MSKPFNDTWRTQKHDPVLHRPPFNLREGSPPPPTSKQQLYRKAMIMEVTSLCRSRGPVLVQSMATQKPLPSVRTTVGSKKNSTVVGTTQPIKLLTRVEELKLLSKAEKAGLLSAAEKFGLSLSTIEKLGVLSKAEEFGVLSAATDPGTPGALLTLSLGLLVLGPSCVYLVPEDYPWEVALQVAVALLSVLGGSAAFAASNFVSNLQNSN